MAHRRWTYAASFGLLLFCANAVNGQQTTVRSPANNLRQGFSENIGVQWGISGPGWSFRFGGPPAPPTAHGARFGSGFNSGDTSGYFNLFAGQGSHAGLSSGSSNLTLGNGQSGGLFEGRQVPFVLGMTPVVGGFVGGASPEARMAAPSPIDERLNRLREEGIDLATPRSEADRADDSHPAAESPASAQRRAATDAPLASVEVLAAARAAALADEQEAARVETADYLIRAEAARTSGKLGLARVYLQMALRRAPADQQREIAERLKSLSIAPR